MQALPRIYQISPEPADPPDCIHFLHELDATLRAGAALVQLRARQLDRHSHLQLARRALALCHAQGARLIFNGQVDLAVLSGCDGVHLSSSALMACRTRPLAAPLLVSAACHDAEQLAQAQRIGVDFATLSPVLPTRSHPDAPPLGWERFAALAAGTRIPLFALGGMAPQLLETAQQSGAWGIATLSAGWRKPPLPG